MLKQGSLGFRVLLLWSVWDNPETRRPHGGEVQEHLMYRKQERQPIQEFT